MPKRKVPAKLKFDITELLGPTPAPIQRQILGSKAFEIGAITGFASGKTRGICALAIVHAVNNKGAKVVLGRKTYRETIDTVKQPFFLMATPLYEAGWFVKPDRWDYREGTHVVKLINGSQIQFVNLNDPVKFRNEEYSLIIADQAEELDVELWETLVGRCRWPVVPADHRQVIAAANDNGHNWVWQRFVNGPKALQESGRACTRTPLCIFPAGHPNEDGEPQDTECVTREFFHGTTLDNRHNLSPKYLSVLMSNPKSWQDRFIYAKMDGSQGRLLPDPVVVDHFDPPSHWPKWRGIDHALSSPACCLWVTVNTDPGAYRGVAPQGVYVYREYYQAESSIDQHTFRILAASKGETYMDTILDRSAFQLSQSRTGGVRVSAADIYNEHGLFCSPSQGDPWARVERILGAHNRGMWISSRCENLIRTMPEYHADATKVEGVYKIINKGSFHAVDALGYALMMIPQTAWSDEQLNRARELAAATEDPLTDAHHRAERRRFEAATVRAQRADGTDLESAVGTVSAARFLGGEEEYELGQDDLVHAFDAEEDLW